MFFFPFHGFTPALGTGVLSTIILGVPIYARYPRRLAGAKKEHYNALMNLLKPQAGAYGVGVEYAYTMVHKAPQSAQKPQMVPKKAAH